MASSTNTSISPQTKSSDSDDDYSSFELASRRQNRKNVASSAAAPSFRSRVSGQLIEWLTAYFHLEWPENPAALCKAYLPPLYFQHDGHSRTIIGLEQVNEKSSLLLFDPSSCGSSLHKHLEDSSLGGGSKWATLVKRGVHTLSQTTYQIVYVKPGIMTAAEREESKQFYGSNSGKNPPSFSL